MGQELATAPDRRRWTVEEDAILRRFVTESPKPTDWHRVASHLPERTNQECRRRWQHKLESGFNSGTWSAVEDENLCRAVAIYGTKWTLVATQVKTRNGDQCFKRWNNALRPDMYHGPWHPEDDQLLLVKVQEFGRNWKVISDSTFPNRTPLALKNRYCLLQRRQSKLEKRDSTRSVQTINMEDVMRDEKGESRPASSSTSVCDVYMGDDTWTADGMLKSSSTASNSNSNTHDNDKSGQSLSHRNSFRNRSGQVEFLFSPSATSFPSFPSFTSFINNATEIDFDCTNSEVVQTQTTNPSSTLHYSKQMLEYNLKKASALSQQFNLKSINATSHGVSNTANDNHNDHNVTMCGVDPVSWLPLSTFNNPSSRTSNNTATSDSNSSPSGSDLASNEHTHNQSSSASQQSSAGTSPLTLEDANGNSSAEFITITAKCKKDRLGALMNAMIGIVDSVAVKGRCGERVRS